MPVIYISIINYSINMRREIYLHMAMESIKNMCSNQGTRYRVASGFSSGYYHVKVNAEKKIYKCGPNLDTLFRVEVFVEYYVYTLIPPHLHFLLYSL